MRDFPRSAALKKVSRVKRHNKSQSYRTVVVSPEALVRRRLADRRHFNNNVQEKLDAASNVHSRFERDNPTVKK